MRQQLPRAAARRGLPTSVAATSAVLVLGALATAGVVGAAGYALGYSPGYFLGYGAPDCPTRELCADPAPTSRTAPTRLGVALNGPPVGGRITVSPNSVGPGAFTTLGVDVSPSTSSPAPTPAPGVTETAISNLVSFDVRTRSGSPTGPATPAVNTGRPLTHWRQTQSRRDPLFTISSTPPAPDDQPGVPASEIVGYVRDNPGGAWRQLPRLAENQPLPAGQPEGYRVDESVSNYGTGFTIVFRHVLAFSRRPSGTFFFARRTGTPMPPGPQAQGAPAAQGAAAAQGASGPAGPGGPTPAFTGPAPRRAVVDAQGRFSVPCAATGVPRGTCRGTATTTAALRARDKQRRTVATGTAPLANGRATVRFKLNRAGRRALRRARRLSVNVTLTISAAGTPPLRRAFKLNLAQAPRRES